MKVKVKVANKNTNTLSETELYIQNQSLAETKKSNKISIINIFATSLIALLGVLIAFLSYNTYQHQLALEKMNSRPIINIEASYTDNNDSINELLISNEGAVTGNINVDIIPFYLIKIDTKTTHGYFYSRKLFLPINYDIYRILEDGNNILKTNYYNTKKGTICKSSINEFSQKYLEELNKINSSEQNVDDILVNYTISNVSIEYFINITYEDILENPCNELYYCVPNYAFNGFKNSKINSIAEIQLKSIDNTDELYSMYELIKDYQNSIQIGSYGDYGVTNSDKFEYFSKGVISAYNNHQYID